MVPPKRTLRGSQNIRTLSGRSDDKFLPHKVFLRVACLEMERERRGQERRSALGRVRTIEDRFSEIDAEKRELMAGLAASKPDRRPAETPSDLPPGKLLRGGSGFKFRY
jgi:hypothetical protein